MSYNSTRNMDSGIISDISKDAFITQDINPFVLLKTLKNVNTTNEEKVNQYRTVYINKNKNKNNKVYPVSSAPREFRVYTGYVEKEVSQIWVN